MKSDFNLQQFLFNLPEDILRSLYASEFSSTIPEIRDLVESILSSKRSLENDLQTLSEIAKFNLGDLISFLNEVIETGGKDLPVVFDFCDLYPTRVDCFSQEASEAIILGVEYSKEQSDIKTVENWFDYLCKNIDYGMEKFSVFKPTAKNRILLVINDKEVLQNNKTGIVAAAKFEDKVMLITQNLSFMALLSTNNQ